MASRQRRRGTPARIWPRVEKTDLRGNVTLEVDMDSEPYEVTVANMPERGARAEVPGQQQIDIVRLILPVLPDDAGLWARVEWMGSHWDVVSPPVYHHGTRHVRHWSMDIRKRPD